ncbi:MAG: lysophospholipid acyltransferase family protein [Rikenellaceae bacterium]
MSNSKLNFLQRVSLELIWLFCRAISITPHWFRYYFLADILFFLIYHCCRYRRRVVDKNLRNAYPELADQQRAKISKEFYHYLAEVVVSTVSLAGAKAEKTILSQDEDKPINKLKGLTAGQSWVALTAHHGLWEYLMFWAKFADQSLIAVYHPLENRVFDELFKRLRNHKNVETVALKETIRYCLEHQDGVNGLNYVVGLIADQNPPRRLNSQWIKFMNQETIFFDGGEKIALKLKMPVYFIYQQRLGRGRYQLEYELIHDGIESVEPFEITRRYVEKLERVIRENPHLWLWSHRRWKHNPNKWKHNKQ